MLMKKAEKKKVIKAVNKTKPWAIYLMVFTTFISTVAMFLLKNSADIFSFSIAGLLNFNLIGGLVLLGLGGILFIIALKNGELSIIYPLVSLSFVWVAVVSHFYFGEVLKIWQYFGIISIILGVVFLGVGNKC
jgi:uncharacterized membrane protein